MRTTPRTFTVAFSQRPNSRLKRHSHVFRVRKTFTASEMRVRISRGTRLADLHIICALYAVELEIDTMRLRWPLSEAASAVQRVAIDASPPYGRPFYLTGKRITVTLARIDHQDATWPPLDRATFEAARLLPRKHDGCGFTISIELQGRTVCPETNDGPRRANRKRSATRNK